MDRTALNRRFHALLRDLGIMDRKEDILSGYGVASTKELTDDQLYDLIGRLENDHRNIREGSRSSGKSRSKHQSNVLAVLSRLGITEDTTKASPEERWREVNEFVRSKNKARKIIPEMNSEELYSLFVTLRTIECKGWKKRKQEHPLPSKSAKFTCYIMVIPKGREYS